MGNRIGHVPVGSPVPRVIRQQRWFPLNVPLMCSQWVQHNASVVMVATSGIQDHGTRSKCSHHCWEIRKREHLISWFRHRSRCSTREPHLGPRSGVSVASGWSGGIVGGSLRDHRDPWDVPRDQGRVDSIHVAGFVPPSTNSDPNWSQLDLVNLEDMFALRVPMLKSCPSFPQREAPRKFQPRFARTVQSQVGGQWRQRV